MAFSGTVSQTVFNTRRVIESAVRRCKLSAEQLSAEAVDIANNQLYLMLSEWANSGYQLWTIEKQIYPLYNGVGDVALDLGTIEVLNGNLRSLQPVTGTNTTSSTIVSTDFTSATFVSTVGVRWGAAAVPIALERSDDGLSWTTVQTATPTAASGQLTWFDLVSVIASRFIRVRATSGTLTTTQVIWGNTPSEIPLAQLNRDDYTSLPNKAMQSSRPLQYWFDRQVRQPVMRLWPVPNAAAETQQLVLWRRRHIMDVGTMAQEIEVPQRWYEAVVAGLAAKLALELPEADGALIPMLDAKAATALNTAQQEERDTGPITIAPAIGAYTR